MLKLIFLYIFFLILLFIISHIIINIQPHPINIILLILLYTIFICLLISLWQSNPMYSILLFLIIISGLLIIFLYFSSLITNVQNKFSINFFILINFIANLIIFLYLRFTNFILKSIPFYHYLEIQFISTQNNIFKNLFIIYSYPFNNFTFLCIFFLLIAIFIIIKLCVIKTSSLRKIS